MSRSPIFSKLARAQRIALYCERHRISTREGIERITEQADRAARTRDRRSFLKGLGGLAAAGAAAMVTGKARLALSAPPARPSPKVAIIGAGLAGLVCADELKKNGIIATIYEASPRSGGRCSSLGGSFAGPVSFPGQVVERGGEFIDTGHKTMIAYANELGLTLEDVGKQPGEVFYYFDGQHHPESVVVDEYRDLVDAMHADLNTMSGAPTADFHTPADIALDNMNLREYLDTRGAGAVVSAAIDASYLAEYGREIDEQSCLNFLLFIHADRRSKFTPFGVFSDERYHVVQGNQSIPQGIASKLAGQIHYGTRLVAARQTAAGQIELTLSAGSTTLVVSYDAVVIAVPFTALRQVSLHASLDIPAWKMAAINQLGYGMNTKMMVAFNSRVWQALGGDGASYSNLPNHQTTWETNPVNATATRAVLTDYGGGDRGQRLDPTKVQLEATRFVADLELVYPGAAAAAKKVQGKYLAHLEHWPSNPETLGSYTCYLPGQFTSIADNEGKRVKNLHFAGEHANSFYEWQGFMEGACLSGLQAAGEILADIKLGVWT